MVEYKLRYDLAGLIVCLYNPFSAERFSTDSVLNYATDCRWQLETGKSVQRVPFYVTAVKSDAERAVEDMRRALSALRKEENAENAEEEKRAPSWGYHGHH